MSHCVNLPNLTLYILILVYTMYTHIHIHIHTYILKTIPLVDFPLAIQFYNFIQRFVLPLVIECMCVCLFTSTSCIALRI